uniref:Cytosol aminopeptidase domain-containing protein n=1 Tax=Glossina pallidipes TaxID=7398 RepID=A0A1A9ZSW3_GLOPL
MKMTVDLKFNAKLTQADPHFKPVLIIGQLRHLNILKFSDIKLKLEPRVTEETFTKAVACLHPSPTDKISLYLDVATLAAVPLKCSRHNTPSRAHAITRLVKNNTLNVSEENIVIVCERSDLFASACAVVRAFPLYSRKTANNTNARVTNSDTGIKNANDNVGKTLVNIEFIVVEKNGTIARNELDAFDLKCLQEVEKAIRLTARIVDTPCNEMNVDDFVEEVKCIAKELNCESSIIRGEQLRERGFGGIYGVGKAAAVPPALVLLSHEPKGAQETIALVGKGIVYDTGGLSIKGKTAMPGMKRDCGGAAAILGAFYAAVKCDFKQNLHAIFCLAENSVGPLATRPDDIHTLYSGRTVEINNTDAEGRLVLADGVCYAQKNLKANIILDMATLTGAQLELLLVPIPKSKKNKNAPSKRGLRNFQDDSFWLKRSSLPSKSSVPVNLLTTPIAEFKTVKEYEKEPSKYNVPTAPVPVVVHLEEKEKEEKKEYKAEDEAKWAPYMLRVQIKRREYPCDQDTLEETSYIFNRLLESLLLAFSGNYVCTHRVSYPPTHVAFSPERDRNNAQSSCAGLFVGAHLGFDYPGIWIHVDMAAPVHFGERATGYGVALLLTLFGNHTNCSMLQEIASNDSEPPTKRVCRKSGDPCDPLKLGSSGATQKSLGKLRWSVANIEEIYRCHLKIIDMPVSLQFHAQITKTLRFYQNTTNLRCCPPKRKIREQAMI